MSEKNPNARELVIYEDEWILAAAKPSGWQSISQEGGKLCFASHMRRKLGINKLAPAHRLDRDTTGVQLFGKDPKSLKLLEKLFRKHEITKYYMAICKNTPFTAEGQIDAALSAWKSGHKPVQVQQNGQPAKTSYVLIDTHMPDPRSKSVQIPASLVLFKPHHGRTHQIRVHAESIKIPIIGDDQYGDRNINKIVKESCGLSRQALHAWHLSFIHPQTDKQVVIETNPQSDMEAMLTLAFPGWQKLMRKAVAQIKLLT